MAVFRGQGGSKKSKPRRTTTKKRDRPTVTKTKKVGAPDTSAPTAAELRSQGVDRGLAKAVTTYKPPKKPEKKPFSGTVDIGFGEGKIDPRLAAGVGTMALPSTVGTTGLVQGAPWVSTSGWTPDTGVGGTGISGIDTTAGDGTGDGGVDTTTTEGDAEEDKKNKDEEEAKQKSKTTAKELTEWWAKNTKGRGYKERKNIFTGKMWGSQEAVSAKIADKINKGYYEIVWQKTNLGMTPMVVHKSTGTPVNPYTGNIVDTQTQGAQGGAYQNDMARITGVDPSMAGVFSMEYQRGNGLSISEMKPQHALRLLMKRNPKAFEEFFNLQKSKGFNPFSLSAIGTGMNAVLSKIFGSDALRVGKNLEKHGWGKAIKDEKTGKYSVQLTRQGAQNWSETFNVPDYISPDAIAKDKEKGWLSDLLGTKKFPDQPIDLTNLIAQEGYFEGMTPVNENLAAERALAIQQKNINPLDRVGLDAIDPMTSPDIPFENIYKYPTIPGATGTTGGPVGMGVDPVTGAPIQTGTTSYPQFTPEGYKISAYNPSRDYTGRTTDQRQTGDGGGGTTPDPNDPTNPYGNLTFDVYGRPIKKYDYTGGPEQLYLGGGWKRDGQYIGSPWGTHHFKSGGIANFKPYGY